MLTSLYPSRILGKITAFAKANRFLLLMMLILIFVREGMIIFDMWTTKEGGDLPEGLISGNFAFDILDGAWRGWDSYLYIKRGNLGNELMTGVFAIPLYLLFGNSLFVLSQVQLLSSLAILSLMYVFCKKYLGSNIAKIASLLFVCLPISVQSYLIYPYYLYFDNFLYTLLAFLLFLKLIDCDKPTTKIASSTLLGFVSGIGFFHTEMYSLTIGCVLFFWFLKNRLFFIKKEFLLFLAGLIVALIPSFCFGLGSRCFSTG